MYHAKAQLLKACQADQQKRCMRDLEVPAGREKLLADSLRRSLAVVNLVIAANLTK